MHSSHCPTDGVDVHGFQYMMKHKPAKSLSWDERARTHTRAHTHTHTHQQRGTNAIKLQIQ